METKDLQLEVSYVRGEPDIDFHEDSGSYLPVDAPDCITK